jgi:lysophospholipid acyltransferase (LPLAT)-like uncharacterized protein
MRRIARSRTVRQLAAWLAALYIRIAYATGRWRIIGDETPRAAIAKHGAVIGCFWHGRMLAMTSYWRRRAPLHVLISQHRDGQLIAAAMERLGYPTIVGSTSKGGTQALREIVRALKAGICVAITPDGPQGPRMRAALGIIAAAKLSGYPIVPITFSASPARALGTWDRFLVFAPFARGVILVGEPIVVPPDADAAACEALRQALEDRLNAITAEADRMCGRPVIVPAAAETTPDTAPASDLMAPG